MQQRQWSRRSVLQLGIGVGIASVLTACAGSAPSPAPGSTSGPAGASTSGGAGSAPTAAAAGQPKRGGTFTIAAAGNPPDLDPYSSGSEAAALFASYG